MKSIVHSSTAALPLAPTLLFSSFSFNNKYNLNHFSNSSLGFTHRTRTMSKQPQIVCSKASKENKLWGGRFEESVTDVVERFTESISFDKALYKHDIMGSRAHASMLAHQVPF